MNEPNPIATDRVDSIDYIPAEAKRRAALSHSRENWSRPLQKIATGIDGFEHISRGGLVEGRTALIVGTSGSGKTLFSMEVVYRAIQQYGRPTVFVTFEERPEDIVRNVETFGWNINRLIDDGRLIVLDASIDRDVIEHVGRYDLSGIIAQIQHSIEQIGAKVVVLDSIGSLFHQYDSPGIIRREIHRMTDLLRTMGVTSLMTAERTEEYGAISRFGIEEFVSDEVIVLRHDLNNERVRRTLANLQDARGGSLPQRVSIHD